MFKDLIDQEASPEVLREFSKLMYADVAILQTTINRYEKQLVELEIRKQMHLSVEERYLFLKKKFFGKSSEKLLYKTDFEARWSLTSSF
ncbi:MAG: hypothetical protein MK008_13440 [Bdellovibrionales bacterium]|nr:hypothetical protein [Bdellovibrionales bacterium]